MIGIRKIFYYLPKYAFWWYIYEKGLGSGETYGLKSHRKKNGRV